MAEKAQELQMNKIEQYVPQQAPHSPLPVSGILQRKCSCGQHKPAGGNCGCKEKATAGSLQRAAVNATGVNEAPSIVHDVLGSHGRPLDSNTRAFMEPRFGYDFSHVRIHDDAKAAESARTVNALAYTVGSHIVFGSGQHLHGTDADRRTLAHELAHVVQQSGAPQSLQTKSESGPNLQRIESQASSSTSLRIGQAGDSYEREADSVADSVMRSAPYSSPRSRLSGQIQRTTAPLLQRRLVINPTDLVPMPAGITGTPTPLTFAIQGLLADTCPDGHFQVNPTSGVVTPQNAPFCQQPPPGPPHMAADVSSTPVGCTCICDVINHAETTTIAFRAGGPSTGGVGPTGTGPGSPTISADPRFQGQYRINGVWVDIPFHLIFAHELCGHALPLMRGTQVAPGAGPRGGTPPHERASVDVERQIAAEHNPPLPRRPEDYGGSARQRP